MPREFPRTQRVNAQLQRDLTELIREELTDPRLKGVTVTRVEVSPDLRNARAFVSLLDPKGDIDGTAKVLNGAAGRLQRSLAPRLRLRVVPHLHFIADHAQERADRLNRLIREAVSADRRHARETPGDKS
jgi:ribosome-binding factor A